MPDLRRIGLFDSGLGGLTVLKEVRRLVPCSYYLYLGDTARVPYGTKSPETVIRYAEECAHFLLSHEVDHIIVACNTASSVALEHLRARISIPVTGTIDATARSALRAAKGGSIGVIGTQGTIRSGAFEKALADSDCVSQVFSIACPLFVPLVEEGFFEGELVDKAIAHYLTSFKEQGISSLILGCTHYPMLKESLGRFFGPNVVLISSSEAVAEELSKSMGVTPGAAEVKGDVSLRITDNTPGFRDFASRILGSLDGISCSKVQLEA